MNRLLFVFAAVFAAAPSLCETQPRIAIIIDDLGYELESSLRVISIAAPVSVAVLPHAPRARSLARAASRSGKDVLLHLPLQADSERQPVEPEHITVDMDRGQIAGILARALESVPEAIGVNNHQGSLATRYDEHMQWLMELIRERDALFFVDSYTTHQSVAFDVAMRSGVPTARRDVFLDSNRHPDEIRRQIERLKEKARIHGEAIAIGHPYPETIAALERAIPELEAEGFELVPISEVVRRDTSGYSTETQGQ